MRVITTFGLGQTASESATALPPVRLNPMVGVLLGPPHSSKEPIEIPRREVFRFSAHAIITTLAVDGVGLVSNLYFVETEGDALEALMSESAAPNETRCYLNLLRGRLQWNQRLGADCYIIAKPRVDRWERERLEMAGSLDEAREAFNRYRRVLSASGIMAFALLDLTRSQVLALTINTLPPAGTIYEKIFR